MYTMKDACTVHVIPTEIILNTMYTCTVKVTLLQNGHVHYVHVHVHVQCTCMYLLKVLLHVHVHVGKVILYLKKIKN